MVRHRWVAIVVYNLSQDEAHRSYVEQEVVKLTTGNLAGIAGPICYACEVAYSEALPECPGPPMEGADRTT